MLTGNALNCQINNLQQPKGLMNVFLETLQCGSGGGGSLQLTQSRRSYETLATFILYDIEPISFCVRQQIIGQ